MASNIDNVQFKRDSTHAIYWKQNVSKIVDNSWN